MLPSPLLEIFYLPHVKLRGMYDYYMNTLCLTLSLPTEVLIVLTYLCNGVERLHGWELPVVILGPKTVN